MASAPKYFDRVMETSTTTGTGTYTLAGAVTGHQSFAAVGNGNSCQYCAMEVNSAGNPAGGWEVGIGTYTSAGTTFSRDTILASSNAGAAVNWAAGTRRVFLVSPAINAVQLIGYTAYSPVGDTILSTVSATLADVDAVNLAVTFVVPSSGKVFVRLTAYCNSGGAALDYWWSLREGAADIAGAGGSAMATSSNVTCSVAFTITGLTPGTSKTWKWSHARSTSGTARIICGPGGKATPPAVMEVWNAP